MVVDTAAQMLMISQSFVDSLGISNATSDEQIRMQNAEQCSYTQCRFTRQVPITTQYKPFNIDVAIGHMTNNFIIGLDFLQEHHYVVDVDNSIVTIDGATVYAVMKKGPCTCYNMSRIQVAQRTNIQPRHMSNVLVQFTNPTHSAYVTTPEITNALINPSCIICRGSGAVMIEVINDIVNDIIEISGNSP